MSSTEARPRHHVETSPFLELENPFTPLCVPIYSQSRDLWYQSAAVRFVRNRLPLDIWTADNETP